MTHIKIYQPIVIEKANEFISALVSANFFNDYGIKDKTFATQYICDKLTDKFIDGKLDGNFIEIFNESEFDSLLTNIVVESTLNEMKEKGYVDSFTDENGEENYFLTKIGKSSRKYI